MKYNNMSEEEFKIYIGDDYFSKFNSAKKLGKVDFAVSLDNNFLLWAEAKRQIKDIKETFVQLILTIGKARTFDDYLPPPFLACFDFERIAFINYSDIHSIFYQNDFNWNITPSDYNTKEFKQLYKIIEETLEQSKLEFYFDDDDLELKNFIKINFVLGKNDISKIRIDKNNFMIIYSKWLVAVKPTIAVDFEALRKTGIIDGDFYLADILSLENISLKEKLFVLLNNNRYEIETEQDKITGLIHFSVVNFNDGQKAHNSFWNKYERPPIEEYWDYIVERRDLLVPQDVRERKGSFFTPSMWVELSQQYITDVLGDDWQDEYVVWDCAAGTGNLLAGLVNKRNIYASTLDKQDVDVMHDRIDNGANLIKDHVFQFDFLNDSFDKLPPALKAIIDDEEKRKKLVIYINPPYAEQGTPAARVGTGKNKTGVSFSNIKDKYGNILGKNISNELYVQFLARIYFEINGCKIAEFSTLKVLLGSNAREMRKVFLANLKKMFIIPADTFDNVKGQFTIGFKVWDSADKVRFETITTDVYDKNRLKTGTKTIYACDDKVKINNWLPSTKIDMDILSYIKTGRSDFQNTNRINITNSKEKALDHFCCITKNNLIQCCVYFAVQKVIKPTWLNDRDQFLHPIDSWQTDREFQSDCLAYALFHNSNNTQAKHGINHFIPFTEEELGITHSSFTSTFMTDFIAGKIKTNNGELKYKDNSPSKKIVFSAKAQAVLNAGLEIYKYYHSKHDTHFNDRKYDVNASYYDIKEFFCGRSESKSNDKEGRMNSTSLDKEFNRLKDNLTHAIDRLGKQIEPKVYEYGFLLA